MEKCVSSRCYWGECSQHSLSRISGGVSLPSPQNFIVMCLLELEGSNILMAKNNGFFANHSWNVKVNGKILFIHQSIHNLFLIGVHAVFVISAHRIFSLKFAWQAVPNNPFDLVLRVNNLKIKHQGHGTKCYTYWSQPSRKVSILKIQLLMVLKSANG